MTAEQLAAQLAQAIPDALRCVVLYGSAAAGDFVPGASNYNLLILVEPLNVAELDKMAPAIADWSRGGNPPPMLFTPAGLRASADAFPIELLDIQQSRRVLWGNDLLADLQVHPEHVRLQIERELTGKLLGLRARYLLTDGNPEAARELMVRSLSTILVLCRAALRLYQDHVPARKLDALHALREHVEFDVEPFERLFELKKHPAGTALGVSFDAYLRAVEAIVSAVHLQSQLPKE